MQDKRRSSLFALACDFQDAGKQGLTEREGGADSPDCRVILESVCGLHVERLFFAQKAQHYIPYPKARVDASRFVFGRSWLCCQVDKFDFLCCQRIYFFLNLEYFFPRFTRNRYTIFLILLSLVGELRANLANRNVIVVSVSGLHAE